jgi:hypothetical protein
LKTPFCVPGSMLLENYHKEHVVLSCVLDGADVTTNDTTSEKFRLLEIDVNSKFYVIKPGGRDIDERRLFYSPLVQRAMKFCNDNSEQWISQLKVIHHIYPQNANQILASQQQNVSMEKSKKVRKTSICDKITVKSASFRYSTSYGNEIARPLIRKQDLEKPNKPKVYDFNYKQTHEFLSLSSNVTKDTNSSSQENSLQMKNDSALPDVSYDRMYVRSNTRSSQDSRSNSKPFGLPFANGSAQSTSENNRDRIHFRYSNNQRKEHNNTHDSITSQDISNQITSTPTKSYMPSQNNSHESKNVKVSSLTSTENFTNYGHENKRQASVQHHFNQNSAQDDSKKNISRSSPLSASMLSDHNPFTKNTNEVSKEDISPVERLDRLTQSCNLLSLLNKTNNSYQNIPSNERIKQDLEKRDRQMSDMDDKETSYNSMTEASVETEHEKSENNIQVCDNQVRKSEDQSHNYKQNQETLPQDNTNESLSLQSLQLNRTSSPKQFDSNKHFYRIRSTESQSAANNSYKQSSSSPPIQKTKPPERNSFSYMHRQETQEQRSNENKPFSIQSNIYRSNSSRNSSPVESNHFSRNQSFNQHNFISNHTMSSYVSSNSSQYSNQNVRNQVTKSPSTASSQSNNTNVYPFNNQNRYVPSVPSNVSRKPSVKPTVVPPIKTHNKTPVPMPRLNVSYAKVHDALDDHNDTGSASSENIYAEISDR